MLENAQGYDYDTEDARDYDIVIFENTGFDSVNIPYRKTTIMNVADDHIVVENLGILQQRFLSYVDVPVIWEKVNAADYCIIYRHGSTYTSEYSFCYFVTNVSMLNTTTARLTLVPDFFTSVGDGGAYELQQSNPKLVIVDGIITRSTRALYDVSVDKKRLEDDPYTNPAFSMEVEEDWHSIESSNDSYTVYIESTIQIPDTASNTSAEEATTPGGDSVVYPVPTYAALNDVCHYTIAGGDKGIESSGTNIFRLGAGYTAQSSILKGIAKMRGMGVESAIIHQWIVNDRWLTVNGGDNSSLVDTMHGKSGNVASSLSIIQDSHGDEIAEAINYCSLCKWGIMSASGDSMEVSPKDFTLYNNSLTVDYKADPRPDGKPYFRIRGLFFENPTDAAFFRNAIGGLPWKQVPLTFQQVSGNALNTLKYEAEKRIDTVGKENAVRSATTGYFNTAAANDVASKGVALQGSVGMITGGVSGLASGILGGGGGNIGAIGGAIGGLGSVADTFAGTWAAQDNLMQSTTNAANSLQTQNTNIMQSFIADRIKDELEYGIAQNVATPTVMFPYNTETIRDFWGNGILIYHYKYKATDITRIRKILRAYGIKYTEFANSSFFEPGNKEFAYLEGAMTIGKRPRWWAEGIEAQLAKGVRIWTVKPHHIGA